MPGNLGSLACCLQCVVSSRKALPECWAEEAQGREGTGTPLWGGLEPVLSLLEPHCVHSSLSPTSGEGRHSGVHQDVGQTKGILASGRGRKRAWTRVGASVGHYSDFSCSHQTPTDTLLESGWAVGALPRGGRSWLMSMLLLPASSPSESIWVAAQPVAGSPGGTAFPWSRPIQATTSCSAPWGSFLPTVDRRGGCKSPAALVTGRV